MTRIERSPAMAASVLLHLTIAALFMVSWRFTRDLRVGAVVPVTIVSNAPATDLRPAEQAPQDQAAMTEAPVPDALPQSSPQQPLPAPAPAPPQPQAAKPETRATPQKPQPKATPEKGLDLDALAASLRSTARSAQARPSSAARGPARAETAQQARAAMGSGEAAAALNGLTEELQRRWNPNCEVEGGREVQVRLVFTLGAGGQVVGQVGSQIRGQVNAVSQAAAERAVRAVYAAAPFRNLPRQFYGDRIAVNFNAREACA